MESGDDMSVSEKMTGLMNAVRGTSGVSSKLDVDDATSLINQIARINITLKGHAADLDAIDDGVSPSLAFIAQDAKTFSPWVSATDSHVPVDGRKWLVFSTGKKEIRKWQLALSDNPVELYSRCWIDDPWTDWKKLGGVVKALPSVLLPVRGCAA